MSGDSSSILVAEAGAANRTILSRLLEKDGHRVVAVGDRSEAEAELAKGDFDVVLLDLDLVGGRPDGVRRFLESRAGNPIPLIGVVSDPDETDRESLTAAGVRILLARPISPPELFSAVRRAGAPPGGRGSDRAEDDPPVSLEPFREFMEEVGLEDLVEETLAEYVRDSVGRMERILAALERGDSAAIEAEAHALKSASRNIWATGLADLLQKVENAGARGDPEAARAMVAPLQVEFARVIAFLDGGRVRD